nr:hypothetical protein BaRGS_004865 [Batillaria attramentaria]
MDDRVAWGVITIPQSVMNGDTADEWFNLSGRLGDGMEGSINLVLTLTPASSLPQMNYVTTYQTPMMMPMYYPAPGMAVYPQQVPAGAIPPQQQRPQQLRPPPVLSEEDMKQIKDMFPTMEDDVIKSVFEANGGNKDATINSLLAMNSD